MTIQVPGTRLLTLASVPLSTLRLQTMGRENELDNRAKVTDRRRAATSGQ
jgi:hypothetical protein